MANKIQEIAYKEELLLLNHLGWMCFKSSSVEAVLQLQLWSFNKIAELQRACQGFILRIAGQLHE